MDPAQDSNGCIMRALSNAPRNSRCPGAEICDLVIDMIVAFTYANNRCRSV